MRILCIGDSNTWGYRPGMGLRQKKRWTRVLSTLMPEDEIIEEGMNGRTLLSVDPLIPERCGITGLKMLLISHKPVDTIVLMLGTNELKNFFPANADYIAKGVEEFIKMILDETLWDRFDMPKLLVVSPILVNENALKKGTLFPNFDENSVNQSKCMAEAISKICEAYDVDVLNAADYAEASVIDGIHMDEENHGKLAEAIYTKLKQ